MKVDNIDLGLLKRFFVTLISHKLNIYVLHFINTDENIISLDIIKEIKVHIFMAFFLYSLYLEIYEKRIL